MPAELANEALETAIKLENGFVRASVSTADPEYRHTKVLYYFGDLQQRFEAKLADILKRRRLYRPDVRFETQLTASGNGDFFRRHNDNGGPNAATRLLTYVWYVNREPKPFIGGQIRLYDMIATNGSWAPSGQFRDIEVRHNQLLLFPSHQIYEVLPVSEATGRFESSRLIAL